MPVLAIAAGLGTGLQRAWAQDDDNPFAAGLVETYTDASGIEHRRVTSELNVGLTATRVGNSQSASAVQFDWEGLLQNRGSKTVQFHAFVYGRVEVSVDDSIVLSSQTDRPSWVTGESVELKGGLRDIQIKFTSPAGYRNRTFGLYWSGDSFQREPISSSILWHDTELFDATELESSRDNVLRGETLATALRCTSCHSQLGSEEGMSAPALTHTRGLIRTEWMIDLLTSTPSGDADVADRRMPHFGMSRKDAADIATAILSGSQSEPVAPAIKKRKRGRKEPAKGGQDSESVALDGKGLFASLGCLACHQMGELGPVKATEFDGGDLSRIGRKRTELFFEVWLASPEKINPHHRMPVFDLYAEDIDSLASYLGGQGLNGDRGSEPQAANLKGNAQRGAELIREHRCGACHQLPRSLSVERVALEPIKNDAQWQGGCLASPSSASAKATSNRSTAVSFGLGANDIAALKAFFVDNAGQPVQAPAERILHENNCLQCHGRNATEGIRGQVAQITAEHGELAALAAALSPPSLTAIGDKLHREAIESSILGKEPKHREWLRVQMPRFKLGEDESHVLAEHFIDGDRIPEYAAPDVTRSVDLTGTQAMLAAGRLVTANGFGCQSCHAIGNSPAPKVDLKARGPNLAMLDKRMRESWFQRWVRGPARIIPRMEMPAIKTPARGLLDGSLDTQLDALWNALNTPGFTPPPPNPESVVRNQNLPGIDEPTRILTDVFETPQGMFLRPIVVGLPNRHNVLFDLEKGGFAQWWIGDAAHQYTRGKTWYWQPGNALLVGSQITSGAAAKPEATADLARHMLGYAVRLADGRTFALQPRLQTAIEVDGITEIKNGVLIQGVANFRQLAGDGGESASLQCRVRIRIEMAQDGFDASVRFDGLPDASVVQVQSLGHAVFTAEAGAEAGVGPRSVAAVLAKDSRQQVLATVRLRGVAMKSDGTIEVGPSSGESNAAGPRWQFDAEFRSSLPSDSFHEPDLAPQARERLEVADVPGFKAEQMPLPIDEMPISLAWAPSGELYVGSLKGGVLKAIDVDGDGAEDSYRSVSANFPTPYGIWAGDDYIDVLTKFALIRLSDFSDGKFRSQTVLADDWGYSHDYHDWAVGLERDASGSYYIALPCQQDDRSPEAARRRGTALKLSPSSQAGRRSYIVEEISAGLRFPMGIALGRTGDLFTTDNQGNYNPFNELNHLRKGKRYGFINKLENRDGFSPACESPAINLPHPWTRSVNGICFLDTPSSLVGVADHFGPFEGHLLGCEMNGRSLVRMSLQRVGDTYQGAAYMFSRPVTDGEDFEGPIVCEVSPDGEIYVGNLHDSGWGGGQNTGSIVRLSRAGAFELGIAEVKATSGGFDIVFTQAVPARLASDRANYSIRSYRKIATPAYGGDDQDIRQEQIASVNVADGVQSVTLDLPELREGFVYEINIDFGAEQPLFPNQAHYTMRSIPK